MITAGILVSFAAASAGPCDPEWTALEGPNGNGLDGTVGSVHTVRALQVFDDGTGPALYAGGFFTEAGGVDVGRIAKWNGQEWSPLGHPIDNGPNAVVFSMAVFDDGTGPALYVAGRFTSAGGVPANRIARWDGSTWSPLEGPSGNGVDDDVYALAVFDDGSGPALFAGGEFLSAGGIDANRIAKWDGTQWTALSIPAGDGNPGPNGVEDGGFVTWVRALTVFDDGSGPALFVGGQFTRAGGATANRIAKWDGAAWSSLGSPFSGTNNTVLALEVFDAGDGPELYVGGTFTFAGGIPVGNIAKWDGSAWAALDTTPDAGTNGWVFSLESHDDQDGSALYVGGTFTSAGGQPSTNISRWDGTAWSSLGSSGVDDTVHAQTSFDNGTGQALYVAGEFQTAGTSPAVRIAQWGSSCTSPPCLGDLSGDGSVDLDDLNIVLANFGTSTENGDTNDDGVVDLADLNAILAAFGTDCP